MKNEFNVEIGVRLKEKRESLRMEVEFVASKINITPGYLGLVERGMRTLEPENLFMIVQVLQMDWNDLFKKDDLVVTL